MWAAGCVMAELLTGGRAFTSETAKEHLLELVELRDYDIGSRNSEAALEHRWFTEEADSPAVLSCLAAIAS
uniref:Protein kinase domain-containing protein n=1 Tax=Oryza barthii TaxID=65489 RepID=A0A0D3HBA1_9ORYZ